MPAFFIGGRKIRQIEALIRAAFPDPGAPGCTVVVTRAEGLLYECATGVADLLKRTRILHETNFRMASVTKQFTAGSIMLLHQQRLLGFDEPVSRYLPLEYGNHITLRHLLNHTSGIPDYERFVPDDATYKVQDADVLELVSKVGATDFPPGSQFRYSNTGYALLALIVERISGQSFAEFLRANIFAPLGMDGSVAYNREKSQIALRAFGYRESEGGFVDADQSPTSAVLGDGGIYSSVVDYRKWDQALYAGQLFTQESLAEAFSPGRLNNGEQVPYGFGWKFASNVGYRVIHHTGETCGFNNCVRRIPELKLLIAVFCNRRGHQARQLAVQIENLVLNAEHTNAKTQNS